MRADVDIRDEVEAQLSRCPGVDATDIAVKVTRGTVMLSGFAHGFAAKYRAEDAAKRVAGVTAIANDIEVRDGSAGRCDPELARLAVAALQRQLPLCWQQIRPVVREGSVRLEGAVEWLYQREEAEAAVRRIAGIAGVVNAIALGRLTAPPPRPGTRDTH